MAGAAWQSYIFLFINNFSRLSMPEMRFSICWPDGSVESCYSPSLVIKDYFKPGETYTLADFLERSRTALAIASERVAAKYGFACSSAAAQLARIEEGCKRFADLPFPSIRVETFHE
jgi:uncharacterized repeat protein (TIGR04042 family)